MRMINRRNLRRFLLHVLPIATMVGASGYAVASEPDVADRPGTGIREPAHHYPPALLDEAGGLREQALRAAQPYAVVRSLVTEVGPRLAGTEGDRAAVAWALAGLEKMGFDSVRAEGVVVPHWERGTASARIVAPYPQKLHVTALGGSVGTADAGLEAPVLMVAGLSQLERLDRDRVAGHVVFFNQRLERRRDGSHYNTVVKDRTTGASAAARRGAVAVVVRSVGTDNNRLPHTGRVGYAADAPPIPALALSSPDGDMLAAQVERGAPVFLRIRSTARQLSPQRSANVIAEITGTEPQDGIVVLAAHLDAWDLGTGALDNGVGVAVVVESARLIAAMPRRPRRTVRVVLFANEELGLSGAEVYAQRSAEDGERHYAGLEADSGDGPIWRLDATAPPSAGGLVAGLAPLLAPLGIPVGTLRQTGGADLEPLRRRGMPEFSLRQDMSDYFDYHHTANDTLDKLEPGNLRPLVAAYAAVTWVLANMEADLGRLPAAPVTAEAQAPGAGP
jgi:hypothetical protein